MKISNALMFIASPIELGPNSRIEGVHVIQVDGIPRAFRRPGLRKLAPMAVRLHHVRRTWQWSKTHREFTGDAMFIITPENGQA